MGAIHGVFLSKEPEMNLTPNAKSVLDARYRMKDENGNFLESYEDIFRRVAKDIASAEKPELRDKWEAIFFDELSNLRWMANSPAIMNAGTGNGLGYFACFVIGIDDTMVSDRSRAINIAGEADTHVQDLYELNNSSITDAVQQLAWITKSGGGVGSTLDYLRPTGDWISTSCSESGGPIGFYHVLSWMGRALQQGGHRRGAFMQTMSLWHPDILKFITCKDEIDNIASEYFGYQVRAFNNYNISVKVSDEEMKKIVESPTEPLVVTNPRTKKQYYIPKNVSIAHYSIHDLVPLPRAWRHVKSCGERKTLVIHPNQGEGTQVYTYDDIFQMITERAHLHGDPGLLYWDRVKDREVLPEEHHAISTNPCGEVPLQANSSCNLGSIDLAKFVSDGELDINALIKSYRNLYRFLDDVVDVSPSATVDIARTTQQVRRVGPGVMGVADMLIKMGVRYNSDQAIEIVYSIGRLLRVVADEMNTELGIEKGSFPLWNTSSYSEPKRNSFNTCIAPTGTISIISGTSCGIEPLFSLAFQRSVLKDASGKSASLQTEVNPYFLDALTNIDLNKDEIDQIVQHALEHGSIQNLDLDKPGWEDIKDIFVTAHDVNWEWHVKHQAAWTNSYTGGPGTQSISKTINFPNDASVEDIANSYKYAWKNGCIGITVYRDGSHQEQPMALKKKEPKRCDVPMVADAKRVSVPSPWGTLHVKVVHVDGKIIELWPQIGKNASEGKAIMEGLGRVLSYALQYGIPLEVLMNQLIGIGSNNAAFGEGMKTTSIMDAIGQAIQIGVDSISGATNNGKVLLTDSEEKPNGDLCPQCASPMLHSEGCKGGKCSDPSCGFSAC